MKTILFHIDHLCGTFRFTENNKAIAIDLRPETKQLIQYAKTNKIETVALLADQKITESIQRVLSKHFDGIELYSLKNKTSDKEDRTLISADRYIRANYAKQGLQVFPTAKIAHTYLQEGTLQLVKIIGSAEAINQLNNPTVFENKYLDKKREVLALLSESELNRALVKKLNVQKLAFNYQEHDLAYITLEDLHKTDQLEGIQILMSDGEKALVSLSPDYLENKNHLHGEHGHNNLLLPDLSLQKKNNEALQSIQIETIISRLTDFDYKLKPIKDKPFFKYFLKPSTPQKFGIDIDRYSGLSDLDEQGQIESRHILHPDNARVVDALIQDLNDMGYCAYKHSFSYQGRNYHNVIADLPGRGLFRLRDNILRPLRKTILDYLEDYDEKKFKKEILELVSEELNNRINLKHLSPDEIIAQLEEIYDLRIWKDWWKPIRPAGIGAKILVVGCHLDSTAGRDSGYNPATDSAPGKDDNASGIAAVLATARYMRCFKNKLRHTVRFCFFNAEEQGLIGSKAYASHLSSINAPVKAAICMDMIGYNSDANHSYEVHCGYTDPAIRDSNIPFGNILANWGNHVGLTPQIYSGTTSSNNAAPDRNLYDGAINRSDHAAFHTYDFSGVLLTEDFFVNLNNEPASDPTPNYHRATDTVVDNDYASKITCSAAYAIKQIASS